MANIAKPGCDESIYNNNSRVNKFKEHYYISDMIKNRSTNLFYLRRMVTSVLELSFCWYK